MTKKLLIFILIIVLASLTGCSAGSAPSSSSEGDNPAATANIAVRPQRAQDLIGRIAEIRGNKLGVAEIQIPQDMEAGFGENAGGENAADFREQLNNMTEEERQEFREQRQGQGQSGNLGAKQQQTYEETGNSYKILIPVGTPIIKRETGQGGFNQTNIEIGDLQKGDILRIWVEELETDGESRVIHTELLN